MERPPPAGLVDIALACGMWELRPHAMTVQDWLSELDPDDEIATLPAEVRDELIGGSAVWPDDYIVVRGWSEGAALLHEAIQEPTMKIGSTPRSSPASKRGARTGRCGCCAAPETSIGAPSRARLWLCWAAGRWR